MMMFGKIFAWLAVATFVTAATIFAMVSVPAKLADSDKDLLERLIGNPLTDPTDKQYCTVTVQTRSCWGSVGDVEMAGWYQAATEDTPARVYFTDKDWITAPKEFKERDFVAESKTMLEPPKSDDKGEERDEAFRRMDMVAAGSAAGVPDLARAAWLAKLGHESLAAKFVAKLKQDDSRGVREPEKETPDQRIVRRLKIDLAWRAYSDAVHAFMQGADQEALRHAKRLCKQYPESATEFGDGKALLAELERREKAKTLGVKGAKKPDDFDGWEKDRQVRWLIEQLEQVNARQSGQPGGVNLARDWRVKTLIAIGDPAVEPLIDVVESDKRLTRSVHFWRDFARSRTVLSVREAALSAVMSILRTRVFEPAATGDNFTSRGEEKASETAARLRSYWKRFGKMSFEDRMMTVLTDKASKQEAMREAAVNLARLGERRTLSTTVFSDGQISGPDTPTTNPAIKKFNNPTTAEAMLAAMDRDLAKHDVDKKGDNLWDYSRRQIESNYLYAVMQLDDKRIAPELHRRYDTANTVRMRRQYAYAAHVLGDGGPLNAFAKEFQAGEIKIPANNVGRLNWDDQPGTVEVAGIVGSLARAKTAMADAALNALADPKHPAYPIAARAVKTLRPGWTDDGVWFSHPYCIKVLRRELDDKSPTGSVASIQGERFVEKRKDGSSSGPIPKAIADPNTRNQRVEMRKCDVAAIKVNELVIGLKPYHPLLKDAKQRLDDMRETLDKKIESLRDATAEEREKHNRSWGPAFIIE